MSGREPRTFRFGDFEADEALRELRREGVPVTIQSKPLQLLFHLLANADRVLSKEELLRSVWPDVTVGEAALTSAIRDLRRALGDSRPREGPIRTLHGQGYRFALPVRVESPPSVPVEEVARPPTARPQPRRAPALESEFVDREGELAVLVRALDAARGGTGRICLLVGPPGIGKTFTARWLSLHAEREGLRVHHARTHEDEAGPPFWVWIQIIRALLDSAGDAQAMGWLGPHAPVLAQLVPEVAELGSSSEELVPLAPDPARFRLFDAIVGLLTRASRDGPQVLVLDDLHWADEASLQVLRFLIQHVERTHTLVVGTLRESELSSDHELRRVLASIARDPRCEKIELRGLSREWVARVIEAQTGAAVPGELLERVYDATRGNPFFVSEVAKLLAAQTADARATRGQASGVPVPARVLDATEGLLAQRTPACRRLLTLASAIGAEFDLRLLQRAGGAQAGDMLEVLAEAERSGFICAGSAPGRYQFAHALVRDALYARLTGAERYGLHATLGEALEELCGDQIEGSLTELARHFCASAPARNAEKAVQYAVAAGDRCREFFAWPDAEAYYRRALDVLGLIEQPEPGMHVDLLVRRAGILWLLPSQTERARVAEAIQLLDRAIELARTSSDPDHLARAASVRAEIHLARRAPLGEPPLLPRLAADLSASLEEAIAAYGDGVTAARLDAMLQLGMVAFQSDQLERGEALCLEVADLAEHHPEARLRAEIARWMRLGADRLEDREAIVNRIFEITEGDPALLTTRGYGLFCRAAQRMEVGQLDAALQAVRDFRALERRVHYVTEFPPIFAAMHAVLQGRWAEAEQHVSEAVGIVSLQGVAQSRLSLMQGGLMLGLRYTQGRVVELLPLARPAAAWSPDPIARIVLAFVLAEVGRQSEARTEFEPVADEELPVDPNWLFGESLRGVTAVRLEDAPRCRAVYARLLPYTDRVVMAAWIVASQGSAARVLALLARQLGDLEASRRHFEAAIRMNQRLGARPWVATCQVEYAELLAGAGDPERARELLAAAVPTARELGMQHLVERAAKLGVSAPS